MAQSESVRLHLRVSPELLARLDAYCALVNRSRNAGVRHLLANSLREFEEGQQ